MTARQLTVSYPSRRQAHNRRNKLARAPHPGSAASRFSVAAGARGGFDAAKAFGARPSVSHLTLSPDGRNVAYTAPGDGPGTRVYTINLAKKTSGRLVMVTDGKPLRIQRCDWVSNERLVCDLFGIIHDPDVKLAPVSGSSPSMPTAATCRS